jgi:ethanolamine ammonia-lyase large subunit
LSNDILAPKESDEIQKLKAALQDANQQRDNLQIEIQKLSASLEEAYQNIEKLKTGKKSDFVVGAIIGESDALQHYGIGRQTLRRPREKDKKIVTFKSNNTSITLEYAGQPDGKGKPHFWKINDIESTEVSSKISQLDLYSC